MANVISLREYIRDKISPVPDQLDQEIGEPYINDSQVWSRDYTKLESVVFGVLKIREVLNYYLYYEDVWTYLLLNLLDAAAHATPENHGDLAEAAANLRNYMVQAVDAANRKNIYAAMLILDLIEKAPGFKAKVLGLATENAAE
jgi:hypothetical protein